MTSKLHIGVEGGSTCSKGILVDREGNVLASAQTTTTNPNRIGLSKCGEVILDLIDELLKTAGLIGSSVSSVGLCVSGPAKEIALTLYNLRPSLITTTGDKKAKVYNDIVASLETGISQTGRFTYFTTIIIV